MEIIACIPVDSEDWFSGGAPHKRNKNHPLMSGDTPKRFICVLESVNFQKSWLMLTVSGRPIPRKRHKIQTNQICWGWSFCWKSKFLVQLLRFVAAVMLAVRGSSLSKAWECWKIQQKLLDSLCTTRALSCRSLYLANCNISPTYKYQLRTPLFEVRSCEMQWLQVLRNLAQIGVWSRINALGDRLGDMSFKFHEACNCQLDLANSYNHIVTKYALLLPGSISHLAPFEKPTECRNLKSFPKFQVEIHGWNHQGNYLLHWCTVQRMYHSSITITISGHLSITCLSPKRCDTFDTMRPPTASPK